MVVLWWHLFLRFCARVWRRSGSALRRLVSSRRDDYTGGPFDACVWRRAVDIDAHGVYTVNIAKLAKGDLVTAITAAGQGPAGDPVFSVMHMRVIDPGERHVRVFWTKDDGTPADRDVIFKGAEAFPDPDTLVRGFAYAVEPVGAEGSRFNSKVAGTILLNGTLVPKHDDLHHAAMTGAHPDTLH